MRRIHVLNFLLVFAILQAACSNETADEGKSEAEADLAVVAHLVEETARGVPHNGAKS